YPTVLHPGQFGRGIGGPPVIFSNDPGRHAWKSRWDRCRKRQRSRLVSGRPSPDNRDLAGGLRGRTGRRTSIEDRPMMRNLLRPAWVLPLGAGGLATARGGGVPRPG